MGLEKPHGSVEKKKTIPVLKHLLLLLSLQFATMKPRTLLVRRLSAQAQLPTKGLHGADGWDLYSARDLVIPPNTHAAVDTDLSFVFPPGCYGRITRASLDRITARTYFDIGMGIIDPDPRAGVAILLFNRTRNDIHITRASRIARLILDHYIDVTIQELSGLPPTHMISPALRVLDRRVSATLQEVQYPFPTPPM